jgi:seryl-tRNA synthetase
MNDNEAGLKFSPAVPIPDHLTGEIQSKLAYVDEGIIGAWVGNDLIKLQLDQEAASSKERHEVIEAKVQRVVLSMAKGAIRPRVQVLEDYMERPSTYQEDPTDELIERGEITPEASGIYVLGPLLSRLIAYFENQFIKLADSFGAEPYRFPTLIPARYLERVHYFRAFPHSLTFATHLREDLEAIDAFAEHAACDDHGLNISPESFAQIQSLLSPAVCYHLYFALADKPLPNDQVVATAVGNCFRYESINLTSLERMWDFTMREVIFVGPKDFVLTNRELARQRMAEFFEQIGLVYRVESANDPFFIGEFRKQAAFQSAFQLKFEISAKLPFKDSTLAVGSYNYHQDFFGRNLNISLSDGSPVHTGCAAFGLERLAFAFLAQFGFDTGAWPAEVRTFLES